jgi:hypothetical protein
MTFANASHFAALAVPYTGPDGRELVIAVVKATFTRRRSGRLVRAEKQVPIRPSDVPHMPDACESSIRYPSDICITKRGTDVVIVGDAISRSPVPVMGVAARIRDRGVHLRVHGERLYYRGASGIVVGPPAPFTRKSVVYERAYGGTSADFAIVERRNPVGRGIARDPSDLVDTPAPQIEDPAMPITSAADRAEPVGFGAIATHWLPRASYAGTFDDAWRSSRMPLMPVDFDVRFNNVAHPSLQFDEPLVAGERIAILGMHVEGLWQIELPAVTVRISARLHDGRHLVLHPPIDTVLLEPDLDQVQLTFRHAFAVGRGRTLLREVRVDERPAQGIEVHAP